MPITRRRRPSRTGARRAAGPLITAPFITAPLITVTVIAATVALVGALVSCGANVSSGTSGAGGQPSSAGELPPGTRGAIGVILPETATSARWEAFDKPFLVQALRKEGFTANVENAQGDVQKFASLADGMIAGGGSRR